MVKSKVKMRINKEQNVCCMACNATRKNSLDMYDICIGSTILTICDECNDQLFSKTLKAQLHTQTRLKTKKDISILNARAIKNSPKEKHLSINEAMRND